MRRYIWKGFLANLPVSVSVLAYGSVLGMLAAQKSVNWGELLGMNLFMFAGSAQFVMIDMWVAPLPIAEITLAVLAVNLRYALIGASLHPIFYGKSLLHKLLVIHLVADENWAVTMAEYRKGTTSTYFLFGGGLCLLFAWCSGTLLGHGLGDIIQHPEVYALDFAFIAVFTALATSLWRGKKDIVPWLVAADLAIVTQALLPGKWYIVIGGVSGALVPALRMPKEGDKPSCSELTPI